MKKKIILSVAFAVIAALAIVVACRWKVWFHNKPEPDYKVYSKIAHVQLSFGENFYDRYVSWQSVVLDTGSVDNGNFGVVWIPVSDSLNEALFDSVAVVFDQEYDADASFVMNMKSVRAKYKTIVSAGGEAGYLYASARLYHGHWRYAIFSGDTVTSWFDTYIPEIDSVSILVLGDVQDKKYTGTDTILKSILALHHVDAILQLGDLTERPHQYYWDRYFDDFKAVTPIIPTLSLLGNHDYIKGLNKHPDPRFFYVFPSYLVNDSIPECGNQCLNFENVTIYILDTNQPIDKLYGQKKWLLSEEDRLNDIHNDNCADRKKIVLMHHPLKSCISCFRNIRTGFCFGSVFNKIDVGLILAAHEHSFDVKNINDDCVQIITNFSVKNYNDDVTGRYYILLHMYDNEVNVEVYNEKHVLEYDFDL